jgi:hypothetical protein
MLPVQSCRLLCVPLLSLLAVFDTLHDNPISLLRVDSLIIHHQCCFPPRFTRLASRQSSRPGPALVTFDSRVFAVSNNTNDESVHDITEIDSIDTTITLTTPLEEGIERTWRYVKKPLLRIGSKGATKTHGNSLRQLLQDHTVVKVKINHDKPFQSSLHNAYTILRDYAIECGAPPNIELIQIRSIEKMILFGLPGTLERIRNNEFPPPPPPPSSSSS